MLDPLPMASPVEPRPAPKRRRPKVAPAVAPKRKRPTVAPAVAPKRRGRPPKAKAPKAPKEKFVRLTKAQRAFSALHPELSRQESLNLYLETKLAKKIQREKAKEEKKQRGQERPGYRRQQTVCDLRIALVQRGILPSELYHTVSKQVRHKNGTMSMKNVKVPLKRPELQALLEDFDNRFTLDRND
jgi:hypothetical protein